MRRADEARILLADDSEMDLKIGAQALKRLGFGHVDTALGGNTAAFKLETALSLKKPYDLLITDWRMPIGSGLNLLVQIRQDRKLQDLPVILLTGVGDTERVRRALESGATDYIIKPLSLETLREKLVRFFAIPDLEK